MTEPQSDGFQYRGNELEIFAHALNWKTYWISRLAPFLGGDVLEVGAGVGANTQLLRPLCKGRYFCIEPDAQLTAELARNVASESLQTNISTGTVESLTDDFRVDTAIYIDVLEHIEGDADEMTRISRHIRPGGHVIVVSPAHQFLYSPFDHAIGHYRRYNRESLLRCTPPGARVARMEYLDSLGGILSLCNRALLKQSYPTLAQILFWDRRVVPVSRIADRLTGFRIGKSILGVWEIGAA